MDLTQPLQQLVTRVPGAHGAALIDSEGEAITYYVRPENPELKDRVRLVSAYHRIWLRDCLQITSRRNLGTLAHLVQKYERGTVVIKTLRNDHALVLLGTPEMYLGQGIFYLDELCSVLNEDL